MIELHLVVDRSRFTLHPADPHAQAWMVRHLNFLQSVVDVAHSTFVNLIITRTIHLRATHLIEQYLADAFERDDLDERVNVRAKRRVVSSVVEELVDA